MEVYKYRMYKKVARWALRSCNQCSPVPGLPYYFVQVLGRERGKRIYKHLHPVSLLYVLGNNKKTYFSDYPNVTFFAWIYTNNTNQINVFIRTIIVYCVRLYASFECALFSLSWLNLCILKYQLVSGFWVVLVDEDSRKARDRLCHSVVNKYNINSVLSKWMSVYCYCNCFVSFA